MGILPSSTNQVFFLCFSKKFLPFSLLSAVLSLFLLQFLVRMDSDSDSEITQRFLFFNVLKDGRIHVISPELERIPPADDPITGVKIKDIEISGEVSARIFLPRLTTTTQTKLPLLLYIHGGGFCRQTAFSETYTRYVTDLVTQANVIAVSVEYGLFPTRPIPACYEDSWAALLWAASHGSGSGPEPWLNDHADLNRVFLAGDSAGGNICHTLAVRAGSIGLPVSGMILIHPYFAEDDKMWMYMCPTNQGPMDPRMRPNVEDLGRVGCGRVLVFVAEKDVLKDAGKGYVAELIKSGWKGTVEMVENKDKEHCFHLTSNHDELAAANSRRIVSFIHHHDYDHHENTS